MTKTSTFEKLIRFGKMSQKLTKLAKNKLKFVKPNKTY